MHATVTVLTLYHSLANAALTLWFQCCEHDNNRVVPWLAADVGRKLV